jgi:hypothetical protein
VVSRGVRTELGDRLDVWADTHVASALRTGTASNRTLLDRVPFGEQDRYIEISPAATPGTPKLDLGFLWWRDRGLGRRINLSPGLRQIARIEPNVMSHDFVGSDSLARAIGEFRQDLIHWIDAELIRLREQAGAAVGLEELSGASGSQFSAYTSGLGPSGGSASLQPGIAAQEPPKRERGSDRDSYSTTTWPTAAVSKLATDDEPRSAPSNPRQRLEALARMLDHRLKHPEGFAETSSGPATGIETDTR